MCSDDAYAGSESFYRLTDAVSVYGARTSYFPYTRAGRRNTYWPGSS